ncbi:hypothetical protein [Thalassobacillus sp. C254]|uniref:Nmad3 family putative nucleotide modification protein n=1 Tax=Thalassobacillus sp. C254 TaxID=1225341 RepID=UPI0018DEB1C2|nr:hypothetical protein [Thalassobacillus sp. C254]
MWYPIPERNNKYAHTIRYQDVSVKQDYLPGLSGTTLSDIYESWKKKSKLKLKNKEFGNVYDSYTHFDPMLGPAPWIVDTNSKTIGRAFGQTNAAPHLQKKRVGEGDVFLFFGGFEAVGSKEKGHFIYGWMKVKHRIETFEEALPKLEEFGIQHHPHMYEKTFQKLNYIFLPDEWLFEDLGIPGCGYFSELSSSLCLSAALNKKPGTWELPSFLYKNVSQVHQKTWELGKEKCTVSTGIGQEFVASFPNEGEQWLRNLFTENPIYIPSH